MTSPSDVGQLEPRERAQYGVARFRDLAFDAVQTLWRRRQAAGMKQSDLATAIGRDRGWVSKNLRAPGNWTLRTIGELIEAMDGEIEIVVYGIEDRLQPRPDYDSYDGYARNRNDNLGGLGGQVLNSPRREMGSMKLAAQVAK